VGHWSCAVNKKIQIWEIVDKLLEPELEETIVKWLEHNNTDWNRYTPKGHTKYILEIIIDYLNKSVMDLPEKEDNSNLLLAKYNNMVAAAVREDEQLKILKDNFHATIDAQAAKIKELEQEMMELRATYNLDW
jgi:hypothetical protein